MSPVPPHLWHADYVPTPEDWENAFEDAGFRSAKQYTDALFLGDQLGHKSGYFYAPDAQIHRYSDRLFVGAAADNPGLSDRNTAPRDWLSDVMGATSIGAWATWGAQGASLSRVGATGWLAASRSSDAANNDDMMGYTPSSIGGGFWGIDDDTTAIRNTGSWAIYAEQWRMAGVGYRPSFCAELEAVVFGSTAVGDSNPYHINLGGGVYGIQLGVGGGQTSGTVDAEAGLTFVANPSKWRKGIVFAAGSLTGTDGTIGDTGFANAIQMGRNQGVTWHSPDQQVAVFHYSTVTAQTHGSRIVHQDDVILFADAAGAQTVGINNNGTFSLTKAGATIEIGSPVAASGSVQIDSHTSGFNIDYDARIQFTGGSSSVGTGGIDLYAAQTYLHGQLRVSGPSYLDGALTVSGATVVAGFTATTATVSGNTTLGGTLALTGAANLASSITAAGTGTFNGLISTGGLTAGAATLTSVGVSGAGYFATTLGVNGAATFAGTATFGGEAAFNATITANATALFNSIVAVAGVASFASTMNVSGRATFNGGLRTTGLGSYASNAAAITGGLSAGDEYLCTALSPPYKTVVQ